MKKSVQWHPEINRSPGSFHTVLGKIIGLFEQGRDRYRLAQFNSIAYFKTTASHGPDVFPESVSKILKGR